MARLFDAVSSNVLPGGLRGAQRPIVGRTGHVEQGRTTGDRRQLVRHAITELPDVRSTSYGKATGMSISSSGGRL